MLQATANPLEDPLAQRSVPVAAVILAAGESRRMGQPKQLIHVEGEPMIVRAVQVALESTVNDVLVVLGAHADEIRAALSPIESAAGGRLRWVVNPDYSNGQASSMRTAVNALAPTQGAAIFMLVDQPFVGPPLINRLVEAWRQGARIAASAVDGRVRGAPAIFDRSLWPELLQLEGDVGARPLLQKYRAEVTTVSATDAELRDFDTPEDLKGLATASS